MIVVYIGLALFGLGSIIFVLSGLKKTNGYDMPLSAKIGVVLFFVGIIVALSAGFTTWVATYNII